MKYFRIQATYNSAVTGKPCGIFGVIQALKSQQKLNAQELSLFTEIEAWFVSNLHQPDFYQNGNEIKGITQFKESSVEMLNKLKPLIQILDNHKIDYKLKATAKPGTIIYEDSFQVGTT